MRPRLTLLHRTPHGIVTVDGPGDLAPAPCGEQPVPPLPDTSLRLQVSGQGLAGWEGSRTRDQAGPISVSSTPFRPLDRTVCTVTRLLGQLSERSPRPPRMELPLPRDADTNR